jgi:hypothetical protein
VVTPLWAPGRVLYRGDAQVAVALAGGAAPFSITPVDRNARPANSRPRARSAGPAAVQPDISTAVARAMAVSLILMDLRLRSAPSRSGLTPAEDDSAPRPLPGQPRSPRKHVLGPMCNACPGTRHRDTTVAGAAHAWSHMTFDKSASDDA